MANSNPFRRNETLNKLIQEHKFNQNRADFQWRNFYVLEALLSVKQTPRENLSIKHNGNNLERCKFYQISAMMGKNILSIFKHHDETQKVSPVLDPDSWSFKQQKARALICRPS